MAGVCRAPMVSVRSIMRSGVLSIISKIPEISVGIQMERSVSISSDRNIQDHLWRWPTNESEYSDRNSPFHEFRSVDKPVLCPN